MNIPKQSKRWRWLFVLLIFVVIIAALIYRVIALTDIQQPFLAAHANNESIHTHIIPANRGTIYDRNGVALAVSTPIDNIVLDAYVLKNYPEKWAALASVKTLNLSVDQIQQILKNHPRSQFMYLKKNVPPAIANQIADLQIPGVSMQLKQKTYYPQGASMAQLVGFTNSHNRGADGLELSFDAKLKGIPGEERVLENAHHQVIKVLKILKPAHPGQDLYLSVDSRIQTIAYEALKKQVEKVAAKSGSVVVLDVKTGEVLAAVSYPSFNPNDPSDRLGSEVKDRAITDQFEPASTVKVLTLGVALESGQYTPDTQIPTSPGYFFVGGHRIKDDSDFGLLTTTSVLTKSSNVGISKIALSLPHDKVYNQFLEAGFGALPTYEFPGATPGMIHPRGQGGDFEYATMAFGYSVAASLIQLAHFYAAIANEGIMMPIAFTRLKQAPKGTVFMPPNITKQLVAMLHTVVGPKGTGLLANIPGYQVAGKTGTSHLVGPHGFYKHRFNAIFIGLAPLKDPRLLVAVRMNDPSAHYYDGFGGVSAAPVFAQVTEAALEFLGVPPTEKQVDLKFFRHQHQYLEWIIHA